jgi:hypothetical protein
MDGGANHIGLEQEGEPKNSSGEKQEGVGRRRKAKNWIGS